MILKGTSDFRLGLETILTISDFFYSLIDNKLIPSNILEEVPVTVHSSAFLTAFLSTLVTPSAAAATPNSTSPILSSRETPINSTASFNTLSLPLTSSTSANPAPLSTPLAALISSLDTHQAHLSTLSFQSRQLARDRSRLDSNPSVVRRRIENEQRLKDGLAPLPLTAEELALVEPSRLETMCALSAVEGAARVLSEATGATIVRSYGARGGIPQV